MDLPRKPELIWCDNFIFQPLHLTCTFCLSYLPQLYNFWFDFEFIKLKGASKTLPSIVQYGLSLSQIFPRAVSMWMTLPRRLVDCRGGPRTHCHCLQGRNEAGREGRWERRTSVLPYFLPHITTEPSPSSSAAHFFAEEALSLVLILSSLGVTTL